MCSFPQGSTALLWACYGGSLEVAEWLVKDAGAKVGHKNKVCTDDSVSYNTWRVHDGTVQYRTIMCEQLYNGWEGKALPT